MFQAKQLCLAIVRTVILERRPVPMVAQAIDVLVTSFSLSVKTGNYVKGVKTDQTSSSVVSNISSPNSTSDVSSSRVDGFGKSIKHESVTGARSETFPRSSTFSASDSEDNYGFGPPKGNSGDYQFVDGKMNRENLVGLEGSTVKVRPSSLQSQAPGPTNSPLNANVSEPLESQVSSPAISPDEIYKFVFAPVEEEMVGEPSYLVAIIVEFLRGYACSLLRTPESCQAC